MGVMDNIRRDLWHRLLEQECKTISLEDKFEEGSHRRCKLEYIKCGYVFICLKYVSFYVSPFPVWEQGRLGKEPRAVIKVDFGGDSR